jgi:hypothetical protein
MAPLPDESTHCVLVEGGVGKTLERARGSVLRSARSPPGGRRCRYGSCSTHRLLSWQVARSARPGAWAPRTAHRAPRAGFPSQQVSAVSRRSHGPVARSPPECRRGLAPCMRQRQASLRSPRGGSAVRTERCNRAVRGDPDLTNSTLSPLKPDADARTEHAARFDT